MRAAPEIRVTHDATADARQGYLDACAAKNQEINSGLCPAPIRFAALGWLPGGRPWPPAVPVDWTWDGPGSKHLARGFERPDPRTPPKPVPSSLVGTEHLVVRRGLHGRAVLERWEAGYLGPLDAEAGLPIVARHPLGAEHAGMSLDQLRNVYEAGGFTTRHAETSLDPGVA